MPQFPLADSQDDVKSISDDDIFDKVEPEKVVPEKKKHRLIS